MTRLTLLCRAAALATLAAAAAPAALRAQTQTAPKVLYACYVPSSGTIYRIKEADLKQECAKSTHVQFSWTDGAQAFTNLTTIYSDVAVIAPNSSGFALVLCPAGSQVVGGGYRFLSVSDAAPPVVGSSEPMHTQDGTGWDVMIRNAVPNAETVKAIAYARCTQ